MSNIAKIRTKPLSWKLCPHNLGPETWWCDAGVFCISYVVQRKREGEGWTWEGHGRYSDSVFAEGEAATLDDAKREAEEDFNNTIAETLEGENGKLHVDANVAEARVTLRAVRLSLQCVENEVDRGASKAVSMGRIKVIAAEAKKAIDGCRIAQYGKSS